MLISLLIYQLKISIEIQPPHMEIIVNLISISKYLIITYLKITPTIRINCYNILHKLHKNYDKELGNTDTYNHSNYSDNLMSVYILNVCHQLLGKLSRSIALNIGMYTFNMS